MRPADKARCDAACQPERSSWLAAPRRAPLSPRRVRFPSASRRTRPCRPRSPSSESENGNARAWKSARASTSFIASSSSTILHGLAVAGHSIRHLSPQPFHDSPSTNRKPRSSRRYGWISVSKRSDPGLCRDSRCRYARVKCGHSRQGFCEYEKRGVGQTHAPLQLRRPISRETRVD